MARSGKTSKPPTSKVTKKTINPKKQPTRPPRNRAKPPVKDSDDQLLLPPPPPAYLGNPKPNSVYPFSLKLLPPFDEAAKAKYESLKSKEVVTAIVPDEPTLSHFELYDDLKEKFVNSGLGILFTAKNPHTYPILVLEFLSTYRAVEKNHRTIKWIFQLGGQPFEWTREDISTCFDCPSDGCVDPDYDDSERASFWKKISGLDGYFITNISSTYIEDPFWKCAHRLIAMNINARVEGSNVFHRDFDLMMAIDKGEEVNLIDILTSRFTQWSTIITSKKSAGLGGGIFVTTIALSLGFNLKKISDYYTRPLDRHYMLVSLMLSTGMKWIHQSKLAPRLQKKLDAKRKRLDEPIVHQTNEPLGPKPTLCDLRQQLGKVLENQQLLLDNQVSIQESLSNLRSDFQRECEWTRLTWATHIANHMPSQPPSSPPIQIDPTCDAAAAIAGTRTELSALEATCAQGPQNDNVALP